MSFNVQTYTRALWEDIYTQKAESFCVRDLIYLIYELENTDFISEDNGRELLRKRMKALNKKTRLLGSKLAREDISNREQIRSIYQNIAKKQMREQVGLPLRKQSPLYKICVPILEIYPFAI